MSSVAKQCHRIQLAHQKLKIFPACYFPSPEGLESLEMPIAYRRGAGFRGSCGVYLS